MVSLNGFDASRVPLDRGGQSRELLPAGKYPAQIISAEVRLSKTGNQYLSFTCCLMGDAHAGRQLRVACNLWHPNPVVKEIAAQLLAKLCLSVGIPTPNDTQELLFKPVMVCIEVELRKDNGREANVVKDFEQYQHPGTENAAQASGNVPPVPADGSTANLVPPPHSTPPVPPHLACKPVIPTGRAAEDQLPAAPLPSPAPVPAASEAVE